MTTRVMNAWVLHKHWTGDTSARVVFFTRELGLIHCLCRGGRTLKKQAFLQPFTPLWLAVEERYDRFYTRSIEQHQPMLVLSGDSLFSGLYINELLYYALKPQYQDETLFDAYELILLALGRSQDRLVIEGQLRRFEWNLIKSCGHAFSFFQDARSDDAILENKYYQFIPGEGFVLQSGGIPGRYILALGEDNLDDLSCLKAAKMIMRKAIDHLLNGRELKSRALASLGKIKDG